MCLYNYHNVWNNKVILTTSIISVWPLCDIIILPVINLNECGPAVSTDSMGISKRPRHVNHQVAGPAIGRPSLKRAHRETIHRLLSSKLRQVRLYWGDPLVMWISTYRLTTHNLRGSGGLLGWPFVCFTQELVCRITVFCLPTPVL